MKSMISQATQCSIELLTKNNKQGIWNWDVLGGFFRKIDKREGNVYSGLKITIESNFGESGVILYYRKLKMLVLLKRDLDVAIVFVSRDTGP